MCHRVRCLPIALPTDLAPLGSVPATVPAAPPEISLPSDKHFSGLPASVGPASFSPVTAPCASDAASRTGSNRNRGLRTCHRDLHPSPFCRMPALSSTTGTLYRTDQIPGRTQSAAFVPRTASANALPTELQPRFTCTNESAIATSSERSTQCFRLW